MRAGSRPQSHSRTSAPGVSSHSAAEAVSANRPSSTASGAKFSASFWAAASGSARDSPPEMATAFWKRSRKSGLPARAAAIRPPSEKPQRMMLSASPPKRWIFSFTQSSARAMSSRAKLPAASEPEVRAGRQFHPNSPSR